MHNNKGIVYKKDLLATLKYTKCVPSWSENDEKKSDEILAQVLALLNFLSLDATTASSKYYEMKGKLSQNKTLLINENPFWEKPLTKCIFDDGETIYFCPSVSILKIRLETIFIRIIDAWINSNKNKKDWKNPESLRGAVCEEYILERLKYHNITDLLIKDFAKLDNQGEAKKYISIKEDEEYDQLSIADFIFETKKYIVILECKNSLGVWRPFYENSKEYFLSLNRMLGTLKQCYKTRQKLKKHSKPVFSLVIANENIWIEGAIVTLILHEANASEEKRSNLNHNLGDFSFISIPMFDYLLSTNSIDRFIDDCKKKAPSQKSGIEIAIEALNCCFGDRDLVESDLTCFVQEFNKAILGNTDNTIN